ncbi:MAG: hypothetical protein HND47_24640 [Chloroflexi bacterium]|nr:hypothetical protein [Chloroflexota bacterium]
MRGARAKEKENVVALLDLLAELRAGSPVLLRVFIIDDHYYQFTLPGTTKPLVKPEVAEVMKVYYHELLGFAEEECHRCGIISVRALPDPSFKTQIPRLNGWMGADIIRSRGAR